MFLSVHLHGVIGFTQGKLYFTHLKKNTYKSLMVNLALCDLVGCMLYYLVLLKFHS